MRKRTKPTPRLNSESDSKANIKPKANIQPKPKPAQQRQRHSASNKNRPQLFSPTLQPVHLRRDSVGLLLLLVSAFVLFAVSAPQTITLEDDGLFVSAAWFAGVVHPPGYPLYTILGWLSAHLLPFGEIPWRVHLVSGFMAAITCVCIAWLVLRRTGNRPAAYLAGAALAVSEHFWSQAIIADVYTTNTALLFLSLIMAQEAVAKRDTPLWSTRLWMGAAFFYGLGLANHWPLLILGSPIFIAYAFASGKEFWGKLHYFIFCVLISVVLLYGWLVWRSHQAPPINFHGSVDSMSEIIAFIKRESFSGTDSSASAGLMDKVYYVRYFIAEWLLQFSLFGGLLALWGIFYTYRNGWRAGCYGEIAAVLSSSLLLIGLLGFDYEYLAVAVFRPYPLVAYCILALWLGLGIDALMQSASKMAGKWHKQLAPTICISFGLLIVILGIWNGRTNYRANDRFAEQHAQSLFDVVEQGAILVPSGDGYIIPTAYYHLVEGKRSDIWLLESQGLLLNDRVVQPLWSKKKKSAEWREFARNTDRPFYHQSLGRDLSTQTGQSYIGFVYKVENSIPPLSLKLETNNQSKQFFKKMLALPDSKDRWTNFQRNVAIRAYGAYLGYAVALSTMENYTKDTLPLAESNYWSLIGMTTTLLGQGTQHTSIAEKYLKKAKQLTNDQRLKSDIASEFYLDGLIASNKGDSRKARNLFIKSIKINSKKRNLAYNALKELQKEKQ